MLGNSANQHLMRMLKQVHNASNNSVGGVLVGYRMEPFLDDSEKRKGEANKKLTINSSLSSCWCLSKNTRHKTYRMHNPTKLFFCLTHSASSQLLA